MILAKFLLPSILILAASAGSGIVYYIMSLHSEINELNNKVRVNELDLIKTKSELMFQSQKLMEQSIKISRYNSLAPVYKANVEKKYMNITGTGDCNQNMGIINDVLLKQGFKYENKY